VPGFEELKFENFVKIFSVENCIGFDFDATKWIFNTNLYFSKFVFSKLDIFSFAALDKGFDTFELLQQYVKRELEIIFNFFLNFLLEE
jgi:hypothetical protein